MKKLATGRRRGRRGFALIEILAATMIVTVAMLGMVGVFFTLNGLTSQATTGSVASSLGRRGVEEAKDLGFANLVDGTVLRYYDRYGNGGSTTKASTDYFSVTTTVSSDVLNGTVPDVTALRTVRVTVRTLIDNTAVETTGTYLAWGAA